MKKFYAFAVVALMSARMFAAPTTIPTAADLASGYDPSTNVVLCCYFDEEICNTIALAGSYAPNAEGTGWSEDPNDMKKFKPLTGFDGWYAVQAEYSEGFQAKPVQLQSDGSFSWNYQAGDVNAWINKGGEGTKEAEVTSGFDDEANVAFGSAGVYIYEIAYFKKHQSPCVAQIKHNYTIVIYAPDACEDMKPSVIGDFPGNSWKTAVQMTVDADKDLNEFYTVTINTAEGTEFKIKEASDTDWSNQMQEYNTLEDNWVNLNNNKNLVLPDTTDELENVTVVYDLSDNDMYRFAKCNDEVATQVYVSLIAPAGAPSLVQVVGSFDGWTGTDMNYKEGKWEALVSATASDAFKFRSGIPVPEAKDPAWGNQIQVLDGEEWKDMDNMEFGEKWTEGEDYNTVECDFSDPAMYKWAIENQQGIENVVLTEKAQKVVVDGVIYIIRNNKMFNLQGAQVR